MMPTQTAIEVPKRLRKRPKDPRGYPIPYVALVDKGKRAHFTISDQMRVLEVATKGLCGLCGDKLKDEGKGAWFIGGPICFTHPQGAFLDPAMHEDCARYAVQVCPYLAAPRYAKRIDDKTLTPGALDADMVIAGHPMVADDRPAVFVLGSCAGYAVTQTGPQTIVLRNPEQDWQVLEMWLHGRQVLDPDEMKRLFDLDNQRHQT